MWVRETVCSRSFFVFWQITGLRWCDRHVLKGNSFNKTLEFGIKYFPTEIWYRLTNVGGWWGIEKISKINLRLFSFVLAGTFSARHSIQKQQQKILLAFSCQYLISVQSQKSSQETLHSLLFSSDRIEFQTIDFTILWDECVREIFHFLWFFLFCFHSVQYWNDDYVGPTTL